MNEKLNRLFFRRVCDLSMDVIVQFKNKYLEHNLSTLSSSEMHSLL